MRPSDRCSAGLSRGDRWLSAPEPSGVDSTEGMRFGPADAGTGDIYYSLTGPGSRSFERMTQALLVGTLGAEKWSAMDQTVAEKRHSIVRRRFRPTCEVLTPTTRRQPELLHWLSTSDPLCPTADDQRAKDEVDHKELPLRVAEARGEP